MDFGTGGYIFGLSKLLNRGLGPGSLGFCLQILLRYFIPGSLWNSLEHISGHQPLVSVVELLICLNPLSLIAWWAEKLIVFKGVATTAHYRDYVVYLEVFIILRLPQMMQCPACLAYINLCVPGDTTALGWLDSSLVSPSPKEHLYRKVSGCQRAGGYCLRYLSKCDPSLRFRGRFIFFYLSHQQDAEPVLLLNGQICDSVNSVP